MAVPQARTWVNVVPGATPPGGAPKWNAAVIQEWENYLRNELEGHRASDLFAHGGVVTYVADSDDPPVNPPTGLPWFQPDVPVFKVNMGTPVAPDWENLIATGTAIAVEEDGVQESILVKRVNIGAGLDVSVVDEEATITLAPAQKVAPVTIQGSATLTLAQHTVLVNCSAGDALIALPPALGAAGHEFRIKKIDATENLLTVESSTGQDLADTKYQGDVIVLESDNATWWIVSPPTVAYGA